MFDVMFYLENLLAAKKVNHTVIIIFAICIYFSRCTLHQAINFHLYLSIHFLLACYKSFGNNNQLRYMRCYVMIPITASFFQWVISMEQCSDELCCKVLAYAKFSILNYTQYFVILVLLFKNASYYFQQQIVPEIVSLGKWLSFCGGQFFKWSLGKKKKKKKSPHFHFEPYDRVSSSVPKLWRWQREAEVKSPAPKTIELNWLQIILRICACATSVIRQKILSCGALLMSQKLLELLILFSITLVLPRMPSFCTQPLHIAVPTVFLLRDSKGNAVLFNII